MQTTLILTAPAFQTNGRPRAAIAAAVSNSTFQLERDIKENIQRSKPAGRTYRRTAIVRPESRRNSALKLPRRAGGVIVGYTFHRASRAGQAPAIDSGKLINSIKGKVVSPLRGRVGVGAEYALPLDDPNGLNRPLFTERVNKFRTVFFENIRRAWLAGR